MRTFCSLQPALYIALKPPTTHPNQQRRSKLLWHSFFFIRFNDCCINKRWASRRSLFAFCTLNEHTAWRRPISNTEYLNTEIRRYLGVSFWLILLPRTPVRIGHYARDDGIDDLKIKSHSLDYSAESLVLAMGFRQGGRQICEHLNIKQNQMQNNGIRMRRGGQCIWVGNLSCALLSGERFSFALIRRYVVMVFTFD